MTVAIDATQLPRKLLSATMDLPLDSVPRGDDDTVALWFPKWVPGSHGPAGPVANVAGLRVTDEKGKRLSWKRSADSFRIDVSAPVDARRLSVSLRYITNQPTTTSMGVDSFGSELVGFVSPNTVILYPGGIDIDDTLVKTSLRMPPEWVASSAMTQRPENSSAADDPGVAAEVAFEPVSVRTFMDSPIMCGRYRRVYDLVDQENSDGIPPHRLQLFSEAESVLELPDAMLERLRSMVTQTARLFRSHPFDQFDILLATTDVLARNGLEHSKSTFNVLGQRSLQDPNQLKGWDRLLVPHEYIHAWCGKYRRPQGMVTSDYHTDKSTELLWVYEGLTQYLGELIEARSGLMSPEDFRHRLSVEVRAALHQQGRDWRSLADTGACSHLLRQGSSSWPRLRRSQDYYMEGMLFWLEADAIIRTESQGEKSLDDFCRDFFRFTSGRPHPNPFTRADVVQSLGRVLAYDWEGLIQRRVESPGGRFDLQLVDRLGYAVQFSNQKPDIPDTTFRYVAGVDALDSIGAVIDTGGVVKDLLLDSPADQAGLGPGMKIIGVNEHKFSENRLRDAISMSATKGSIEVLVESGDSFITRLIEYDRGPRFMVLVPKETGRDLLVEILRPLP